MDNQYNAEFAEHLSSHPLVRCPILLDMGRFQPAQVLVSVKESLSCSLRDEAVATP